MIEKEYIEMCRKAVENNKILQELLKDVPHDNKRHHVEMTVKWEGYHVIIMNKGENKGVKEP